MKRILSLVGGLLLIALPTTVLLSLPPIPDPAPVVHPPDDEQEGIVQRTTAFWIGMPDEGNSMPFLNIAPGTKIIIMDREKDYYQVKHKNLIGFVEQRNVKIVDPDNPEEAMPKAVEVNQLTERGSNRYRVTQSTSLRVRPDSQSGVILRLRPDDRLEVLDDSGKWWWKVRHEGKTGWAKAALLRAE